jgi:N-acetylglucosamine repressor
VTTTTPTIPPPPPRGARAQAAGHSTLLSKGNNRAIREVNRSIILDLVRRDRRISRTELARRSKLTKPTVSTIVDELIADGVVREVGFGASVAGGGRPARLLDFNEDSAAYLGIHFGMHTITVAVADARGHIAVTRSRPAILNAPARSLKALRPLIADALRAAKVPRSRIEGAGATVPGLYDQESGVCVLAPNLGWHDFPVRAALAEELGMPVNVNNITHAAAVAEGRVGAAQGARSYAWVYVGMGIGAGIVADGRLFFGQRGFSGEIGHCPVVSDGPVCGCGRNGCLETVASTMAITRAAEAAIAAGEQTVLRDRTSLDAATIVEAARGGDAVTRRILAQAGEHLGRGISYLLNLLNPEMVILAGPYIEAGETLLRPLRESVDRHSVQPKGVAIVPSTLGERADVIGSVLLVMDQTMRSYRIVGGPSVPRGTGWGSGSGAGYGAESGSGSGAESGSESIIGADVLD